MISQTAEYALRAIISLAEAHPEPMTTSMLSIHTKVQSGYLSKVMQHLVRGGLITSKRGLHGGFVLARNARDITMLHVVEAVETIPRIESCPLFIGTHGTKLCALHRKLDNIVDYMAKQLRGTTIAELLSETKATNSKPLCTKKPIH